MFDNIGNKIKTYAELVSLIGIILFAIIGIISVILGVIVSSILLVIIGIMCAIGCLVSWISVFVLYGFGQLVENSDIIVKTLAPNYREDQDESKKMKKISDVELEKIRDEYSNSDWVESIKNLSNEELQERIDSDDWQFEYRALCKKELESRK